MKDDKISNYGITFLSILIFGIIGVFTIGFSNGIPVGLIIGVVIGLLVSILILLERIFKLLIHKCQTQNND